MRPEGLPRRSFVRTAGAIFLTGVAGCNAPNDTTETTERASDSGGPSAAETETRTRSSTTVDDGGMNGTDLPEAVRLEPVATGFASPVGIEVSDDGRRFVVDQAGLIRLHDETGLRDRPYLDVRDRMVDVGGGYSEQGLLGMALHPNFTDNGRLYVRYSAPRRQGTPRGFSHTFVLSEFSADPGAQQVDPATERTLLEIPQPQSNHNAGAIVFGPEGYLYVATGDGGGAGDSGTGHVSDWYDGTSGGNGQDVTRNLLGSILRIDVDDTDEGRNYGIPDDNPLVGQEGYDEQYAWGVRNPWRMSFTDGDLYAADVGQNRYEEVNRIRKGGNYGWNVREGFHCFRSDSCPRETSDGEPIRDPVIEYSHAENDGDPGGAAVVGGYLYRGAALPGLEGRYVFADWQANGRLFVATPGDADGWPIETVQIANESDDSVGRFVLAFGRGQDDDLYLATTDESSVSGTSGAIHRIQEGNQNTN